MQIGIFVLTFFFSWLAIELISQWRYPNMNTTKKTAMIVVIGLLQFYFIACSGSKDNVEEVKNPEVSIIRNDGYKEHALADFASLVAAPQSVEQVIEEEEWIGKHFIWRDHIYTTMWEDEIIVN
jgi:hypothetical protein